MLRSSRTSNVNKQQIEQLYLVLLTLEIGRFRVAPLVAWCRMDSYKKGGTQPRNANLCKFSLCFFHMWVKSIGTYLLVHAGPVVICNTHRTHQPRLAFHLIARSAMQASKASRWSLTCCSCKGSTTILTVILGETTHRSEFCYTRLLIVHTRYG